MSGTGTARAADLPPLTESIDYIRSLRKPTAADVLHDVRRRRRVATQPRGTVTR